MENPKDRHDLIAHLRQQIEQGTYVTQRKLEITAEKLLKKLALGPSGHGDDA